MKKLIITSVFAIISLVASSQTSSSEANRFISSMIVFDHSEFSKAIAPDTITLAVNDCKSIKTATRYEISNPMVLADSVFSLIKNEIGKEFFISESLFTEIERNYFGSPYGAMVIFENNDSKKIKVDFYMTDDLKIEFITIQKDACRPF